MKRNEIDTIYTAKVTEYIMNGYTIRTDDMGGSQGQIASIHLVKGNELIVVAMSNLFNFTKRPEELKHEFEDGIEIFVKRFTKPMRSSETIWLGKGELVEVRRFYELQREDSYRRDSKTVIIPGWYIENWDEFIACRKVHYNRYRNHDREAKKEFTVMIDGKIMDKVRATYGCKRAKLADAKVTVHTGYKADERYTVYCNGKHII